MEIKTIKVSEKGQIAIPTEIREKLGIKKGDSLVLFEVDGKLLLEKTQKLKKQVEDDFMDMIKLGEEALKDIWDNKEEDIWNRYLKK